MFKIAVLVSGSGPNMLQLIKNDIKIDCIIADRECKAEKILFSLLEIKKFLEKYWLCLNLEKLI